MNVSPSKWGADELRRFYRAFHKYGSDFYKVSKMVGGGKAPEMCAALWRRHQAYLTVDKKFQSEVGFLAIVRGMVDRPATTQTEQLGDVSGGNDPKMEEIEIEIPLEGVPGGNGTDDDGLSDAEINPAQLRGSKASQVDLNGEEADVAALVVSMSSPGVRRMSLTDEGDDTQGPAGRSRRTPKRSASVRSPSALTPGSYGKRFRSARDEEIYEYGEYEEGVTESARKRRASQKRLDFETYQPAPTRRRAAVDEKNSALMLLTLAGGGGINGDGGGKKEHEEEEEGGPQSEDDELGAMFDDDNDEDYREGRGGSRGGGRRTPYSTPAKSRGGRPGSSHTTPRRSSGRVGTSPGALRYGLASPIAGWMGGLGGEGDLMADFHGNAGDVSYLSSPGLPPQLPAGYVPSPKNPMPRLRRRKSPPERSSALMAPLKGLFSRRQGLNTTVLLASSLGIPGASPLDDSVRASASPAERRLRHCLCAGIRRWCFFEFFYPAIDRPWFMDTTMSDLASHVGLPQGAMLTRKEWNVLRSAGLGRPRRLSLSFLRESRAQLESQRVRARDIYSSTMPDPVAFSTLPRPLTVGQRVAARHPATRQLHDGSVLTVAHNTYRVQFDRRELGVELVRDTEIMPVEPWENLPLTMLASRPRFVLGGRLVVNGRPVDMSGPVTQGALPGGGLEGSANRQAIVPSVVAATAGTPGGGPSEAALASGSPMSVPDPHIMAELATTLDKKEAILAQLRLMNDEATSGVHNDPTTGNLKATFTQMYAQVSQRLQEVNNAVRQKLQEMNDSANPAAGSAAAALLEELANAAAEGTPLPPDLLEGPITSDTLCASTLSQARNVMQSCKQRIIAEAAAAVEEAAKKREEGAAPSTARTRDTEAEVSAVLSSPLGKIIEGALWSLVTLQQGSDKLVPTNALLAALDTSILGVKPKAVVNAGLYTEVENAMKNLKIRLLAA